MCKYMKYISICVFAGTFSGIHGLEMTGPIFIKEPSSRVEFVNTNIETVDCVAHGSPDPSVAWFANDPSTGSPIRLADLDQRLVKIVPNNSLVFNRFDVQHYSQGVHNAIYTCYASNLKGRVRSIEVKVRAVTEQQQQHVKAQVYDEFVVDSNPVVFKCHFPNFFQDDLEVIAWIREDNLVIKPRQTSKFDLLRNFFRRRAVF